MENINFTHVVSANIHSSMDKRIYFARIVKENKNSITVDIYKSEDEIEQMVFTKASEASLRDNPNQIAYVSEKLTWASKSKTKIHGLYKITPEYFKLCEIQQMKFRSDSFFKNLFNLSNQYDVTNPQKSSLIDQERLQKLYALFPELDTFKSL